MGLNRETYESGKTTFTTTLHINLCPLLVFNIFVLFFLPANESRSAARPTCPAKNPPWEGFEPRTWIRIKDLMQENKAPLPPHYTSICVICMRSLLLYLVLPPANEELPVRTYPPRQQVGKFRKNSAKHRIWTWLFRVKNCVVKNLLVRVAF
jgi:hypothetical protein